MYDFYFGTKEEIQKDPKKFLLAIKRMLPRWCNSIPDSEYLALYDCLSQAKLSSKTVIVETGSGASTIVLLYFALLNDGELYTWDTNGSKLFFLRGVIGDTLMKHFNDKNLYEHWKYVPYTSVSPYMGIPILKEMNKQVSVCFFDSEHTWKILGKEIEYVSEVLRDGSIVSIDDANYSYEFENVAYVNMLRKKCGLSPVEIGNNEGEPFWKRVSDLLKEKFREVTYIKDSYKQTYQNDLFWAYFRTDRAVMTDFKMEKTENLKHRFDAWRVYK